MALPQYPLSRRREIAIALDVDEQYVYQVMRGLKVASPALARRLNHLDPAARLQELRPVDWQIIWPELVCRKGAAKPHHIKAGA